MKKITITLVVIGLSIVTSISAQTPTPTPECSELGVTLELNQTEYHVGDMLNAKIYICNPSSESYSGIPLVVVLNSVPYSETATKYYPSWSSTIDYELIDLPPGLIEKEIINVVLPPNGEDISWLFPLGDGDYSFNGSIMDSGLTQILGKADIKNFTINCGYSEHLPTPTPNPTSGPEIMDCLPNALFSQPFNPNDSEGYVNDLANPIFYLDDFDNIHENICGIQWWGMAREHDLSRCVYCVIPGDVCVLQDCDKTRFRIIFYEDENGHPGNLIETKYVTAASYVTNKLWEYEYFGMYCDETWPWAFPATGFKKIYTAYFEPCISMTNGWISIQAEASSNDCTFRWLGSRYESGQPGGFYYEDGYFYAGGGSSAFCLLGSQSYIIQLTLSMPTDHYTPGSTFRLDAHLVSNYGVALECNLFIILEMNGGMWFWPGWKQFGPPDYPVDFELITVNDENINIIPEFAWPTVPVPVEGLHFWGACTDPAINGLVSNFEEIEWGFGL